MGSNLKLPFLDGLTTRQPAGKIVFTILGALAELERSLIVERVKAGRVCGWSFA